MLALRTIPAALACCAAMFGVQAQEAPPVTIAEQVAWKPLVPAPGVDVAFLSGAAGKPGLYELRVRMAPDSVIPPHMHSDTRYFTILSGDLYAGVGETSSPIPRASSARAPSWSCRPACRTTYWPRTGRWCSRTPASGPPARSG